MKCSVLIDSSVIGKEDIDFLNNQNTDIHYSSTESNNFLPSEVILVLIDLARNIGYNATYDILKYALLKVVLLLKNKKADHAKLQFEISCNGKTFSVKGDTALTEQQMDKLVDAATEALIAEWNCKENSNEKQ